MQLIAHRDVREPDLAHLESPFFASSKVRLLLLGNPSPTQLFGLSNFAQPAFDSPRRNDELLHEVENGDWFLVVPSSPGPFRPAVVWQSGSGESADGRWTVDESLSPTVRLKLEHVIARIEREKRHAQPQQEILAISGAPRSGILKRYANFFSAHQAFPEHLTATEEKGWGSSIRGLYGGNDTIQNQADITAFNDTPSVLGVTHGQIFDAMENVVAVAGLLEGGLALSKLMDVGKVAEGVSSGIGNRARTAPIVSSPAISRESIVGVLGETIQPHLKAISDLDPDALVGFRGSLARGYKGPHKGNAPFDPESFDVDAFIVSDKLAAQFSDNVRFRSGIEIEPVAKIQSSIDSSLRQKPAFGGLRDEPFTLRIFTRKEIEKLQAKPDAQYFFIKGNE